MGFQNLKTKNPNFQWQLLIKLANNDRKMSWDNPDANDKIKKHKQLLSEKLRKYFFMTGDPFYLYKKEKLYEIKLNLIPENKQYEELIENVSDDELGIKEHLNEIASSIKELPIKKYDDE